MLNKPKADSVFFGILAAALAVVVAAVALCAPPFVPAQWVYVMGGLAIMALIVLIPRSRRAAATEQKPVRGIKLQESIKAKFWRRDDLVRAREWAQSDRLHAETITQTRLNNFLFSSSILIVAWATVYAISDTNRMHSAVPVLRLLAGANLALSSGYFCFGLRSIQTINRHSTFVGAIEERLPEVFRAASAIENPPPWLPLITHDMIWMVPLGLLIVSVFLYRLSGS